MGAATLDQPCTSRGKLEDYVVMPLGHNNKLKVIVESLYLSPAWVPGESAGRTPMASSGTWMHNIQSHRPARPSPPVAGCGHEWAGPSGGAHGAGSVDR
jgi:hypothetical protein